MKIPTRSHYLGVSARPPVREGLPVIVLRPALWSGASGVAGAFNPDTALQTVTITGRNGEGFSTEVTTDCLKIDHARLLEL